MNYAGGPTFAVVIALAATVGAWECSRLLKEAGARPFYLLNLPAAAIAAALPFWMPRPQSAWIGIIVLSFALIGAFNLLPHTYSSTRPNWILSLFPILYSGVLLGHLHLLRHAHRGAWWVISVLVMTWAYDTGAYFAGRYTGRRPFMHHISPKKTMEGVIGGLVLSTLAGLVAVVGIGIAWWQALIFGMLTGMVAQLGDLIESMLKRQTGKKDSGRLMPGHGGLLDRIDSLLLTGALGYYAAAVLGYAS